jgi:hypothetical protein
VQGAVRCADRQVRELSFGARIAFAKESAIASARLSSDGKACICFASLKASQARHDLIAIRAKRTWPDFVPARLGRD